MHNQLQNPEKEIFGRIFSYMFLFTIASPCIFVFNLFVKRASVEFCGEKVSCLERI